MNSIKRILQTKLWDDLTFHRWIATIFCLATVGLALLVTFESDSQSVWVKVFLPLIAVFLATAFVVLLFRKKELLAILTAVTIAGHCGLIAFLTRTDFLLPILFFGEAILYWLLERWFCPPAEPS